MEEKKSPENKQSYEKIKSSSNHNHRPSKQGSDEEVISNKDTVSAPSQEESRKDNKRVKRTDKTKNTQDNKEAHSIPVSSKTDDTETTEKDSQSNYKVDKNRKSSKTNRSVSFNTTKSLDNKRLRHIFRRPLYTAPKHPIFSSPFAKRISLRAFGPKKPVWYKKLNASQISSFRRLISHVDLGRKGYFRFDDFLKTFQDFDPTITREEILSVFDSMEVDEFEELDFGKFLFLLASANQDDELSSKNKDSTDKHSVHKKMADRRSLILSGIANFVLLTSFNDIDKYYVQSSRKKPNILHKHLEVLKLKALSEAEMEIKQIEANRNLKPLFEITGSPYAQPVPFVPKFTKGKVYRDWKKSKYSLPHIDCHQTVSMPLVPPEVRRKLGEDVFNGSDSQDIVYKMNYGRIPLPKLHIPVEKVKEMRGVFTVALKDYLMERAFAAKNKFRNRLRNAAVQYAKTSLVPILQQGFPTKKDKENFIEIYERYHPLN